MVEKKTGFQPDSGLFEIPKAGVNFTGDAARERADLARAIVVPLGELNDILNREHGEIQDRVKNRSSSESTSEQSTS